MKARLDMFWEDVNRGKYEPGPFYSAPIEGGSDDCFARRRKNKSLLP